MDQASNRQLRRIGAVALAVAAAGGATAAVAEAMSSQPHRAAKHTTQATVGVKRNATLGQILDAGSRHLTVYIFAGDRGTKSRCSGACASVWPAVTTVAKPKASGGARSAVLGTTRRSGGVKQVTYKGHPLYYFKGDRSSQTAAGQALDGFGARWYVITPAGHVVTTMPSSQSTTPTDGGTQTTGSPTTTTGSPTTTTTTPTTTMPDGWS